MSSSTVTIHYRRLPDRSDEFQQLVLHRAPGYVVTALAAAVLPGPVRAGEQIILEPGAPVIWFTYPGAWFDIGRFHLVDGTFTGTYANVLTPVHMDGDQWETTDLCLDVWKGADGRVEILDRQEFERAVANRWMDDETALRAVRTAEWLATAAREGSWPPQHVEEWTLERARRTLADADFTDFN